MEKKIYMTPRQPFFVTDSAIYKKYVVNRFGIVHFYHCKTGSSPVYAIPDGCVDMVFCCDSQQPYAEICGTVLSPETVLMKPHTYFFGVRFLPGYNPVLGIDNDIMTELINHRVPLDLLIHDERMLSGIFGTTDFFKQINVFMHSYMSIYKRICPYENENLLVLHSLNLLIRSSGFTTVEKLAEDTGYTVRYINKCFHEETGLSPKCFAQIIRFQSAVSALNEPQGKSLTDIAAELGYFDQAHFIHDFKKYTGLTPKKYQSMLKNHDFRQRLQIIPDTESINFNNISEILLPKEK